MQSNYAGHIVRSEWRWLFFISITFILVTILPLLIVALRSLQTVDGTLIQWQFMGAIHSSADNSALLSRMLQGAQGNWFVYLQHTPDVHKNALIQPVYALLGQLSSPTTASIIMMFHLARLTATFIMYVAIYNLGASIWVKIRSRRIFFIVASLGAGAGWLMLLFASGSVNEPHTLDLTTPQAFPFASSLVNVHYPLTIAALASLSAIVISVLRPGNQDEPSVNNAGLVAFIVSLGLAFLYPEVFLPFGIAFILSILAQWFNRGFSQREMRWALWILVPALPILSYYSITVASNPTLESWINQRLYNSPTLVDILLGVALPLAIALSGIWRALRYFEADGDRFMILWLGMMLLIALLPIPIKSHALVALMLPVAYFTTRSIEDYWFNLISRRRRRYAYIIVSSLILITHAFTLFLPVLPIAYTNRPVYATLSPNYIPAFEWLNQATESNDVIFASPRVSQWIPFWTGARTYYGHPAETMQAPQRYSDVMNWYRTSDEQRCVDILYWRTIVNNLHPIYYVILGPHERAIGETTCLQTLTFVVSFGDVSIYATNFALTTP